MAKITILKPISTAPYGFSIGIMQSLQMECRNMANARKITVLPIGKRSWCLNAVPSFGPEAQDPLTPPETNFDPLALNVILFSRP